MRLLWILPLLIGCHAKVELKKYERSNPPAPKVVRQMCDLSLDELITSYERNKFCSIAKYEDHEIRWVVDDLPIASTGMFYRKEYREWDIDVFLTSDDCCVPELPSGKYVISGYISYLSPGHANVIGSVSQFHAEEN